MSIVFYCKQLAHNFFTFHHLLIHHLQHHIHTTLIKIFQKQQPSHKINNLAFLKQKMKLVSLQNQQKKYDCGEKK